MRSLVPIQSSQPQHHRNPLRGRQVFLLGGPHSSQALQPAFQQAIPRHLQVNRRVIRQVPLANPRESPLGSPLLCQQVNHLGSPQDSPLGCHRGYQQASPLVNHRPCRLARQVNQQDNLLGSPLVSLLVRPPALRVSLPVNHQAILLYSLQVSQRVNQQDNLLGSPLGSLPVHPPAQRVSPPVNHLGNPRAYQLVSLQGSQQDNLPLNRVVNQLGSLLANLRVSPLANRLVNPLVNRLDSLQGSQRRIPLARVDNLLACRLVPLANPLGSRPVGLPTRLQCQVKRHRAMMAVLMCDSCKMALAFADCVLQVSRLWLGIRSVSSVKRASLHRRLPHLCAKSAHIRGSMTTQAATRALVCAFATHPKP